MPLLESYLVRIYHRNPTQPQLLIGMVEDMTVNDVWTFESEQELIEILRRLEKNTSQSRSATTENASVSPSPRKPKQLNSNEE